ncbi:MAG: hypothetical protein J5654_10690, partial [Victivallales bacterium]|nr:hypothetical protein [Victivallales bacterium]
MLKIRAVFGHNILRGRSASSSSPNYQPRSPQPMKLPKNIKKAAVPACLCLAVLLAGIGSCRRRLFRTPRPRITMSLLDERAQPYIDEARAGVRDAVSQLCARRGRLFWLLLKSRFGKSSEAQRRIAAVLEPRVVEPLRKAA